MEYGLPLPLHLYYILHFIAVPPINCPLAPEAGAAVVAMRRPAGAGLGRQVEIFLVEAVMSTVSVAQRSAVSARRRRQYRAHRQHSPARLTFQRNSIQQQVHVKAF